MTAEEVGLRCQVSLEQAVLAKQREYDEPFEILDTRSTGRLLQVIEEQGKRWTRGGRFYHILGNNDKATAVHYLIQLYRKADSDAVTIGLGDGLNDLSFLNLVDIPIFIHSRDSKELKDRLPHGRLTPRPGPEGWNEAVLEMIPE